jgi:ParB-like chromosome segregation protein Spo0J
MVKSNGRVEKNLMATVRPVKLGSIRLDFQSPELLDQETVQRYRDTLRSGGALDPLEVYFDGNTYWLADGFHRIEAARGEGLTEIDAKIVPGTYADLEAEWQRYLLALRQDLAEGCPTGRQDDVAG